MKDAIWRWDELSLGPLCVESIRALHQPPEHFRVSPNRFLASTAFVGIGRAGRKYVMSGSCSFTIGASTWELHAGDIADLPAGEYEFRVLGEEPVEFVSVWELPAEVWACKLGV
jgi:hypothetical protein